MVTMLDCIKRSSIVGKEILDDARTSTDELAAALPQDISAIILVGSGSSNNANVTAAPFIEMVSGVSTYTFVPNNFKSKTVLDPKAVYVFSSQSGTSTFVRQQVERVNQAGGFTVAVTDDVTSPIAKAAKISISIGVGGEEYGFRTVGFTSTFLTLMIIGLRIGFERKHITKSQSMAYVKDGYKAVENHPVIVEKTLAWFDEVKDQLKGCKCVMYYGSGSLYGIALEGALKLLETAKIYKSIGFELEDGLHGPCYAFYPGDVVIALNNERDNDLAQGVVSFSKIENGQGYMFGKNPQDEKDLAFEVKSRYFEALEFAPAVEIVAYMLAVINDIPVQPLATRVPHSSSKYFQTHKG